MSEVKFKVGDLVYCPDIDNRVHTLESYDKHLAIYYNRRDNCDVFYFDGTSRKSYAPRIFHATQENYELLSKLYPNVEFEPPPKRKDPREIIQAMFESGKWYLVNYRICTNTQQILSNKPKNKVITKQQFNLMNYDEYFNRYAYCNIEVICPNTGKAIIDFVNGEVVLED